MVLPAVDHCQHRRCMYVDWLVRNCSLYACAQHGALCSYTIGPGVQARSMCTARPRLWYVDGPPVVVVVCHDCMDACMLMTCYEHHTP